MILQQLHKLLISAAISMILFSAAAQEQEQIEEFRNCAVEYMYQEDYDHAIEYFTRVIELAPQDSIAYFDRGMAKEMKGDILAAIDDYSKQIEVTPNSVDSYFLRAMLWDKLNRRDLAIQDYSKVLELEYDNADAHLMRGIDLKLSRRYQEALDDIGVAISIDPERAEYYFERAEVEIILEDTEAACKDYMHYRELSGEKPIPALCN